MKTVISTLCTLLITIYCYPQMDTIYQNNEKIICDVKEITQDAVKFSYPDEELVNTIYKNTVNKIVFKNGRNQVFNESTSFRKVENVNDFSNVTITHVEGEVKGLYKIGEVSAKAVGTTIFSNQEQVKDRAYDKLKILAAFQGGNIIYLANERTESYDGRSKAETNLTGVLYSNRLPRYDDFARLVSDRSEFIAIKENKLKNNGMKMEQVEIKKTFELEELRNENGLITIKGSLKGEKNHSIFRVVSFSEDSFNIYFDGKRAEYNVKIKL